MNALKLDQQIEFAYEGCERLVERMQRFVEIAGSNLQKFNYQLRDDVTTGVYCSARIRNASQAILNMQTTAWAPITDVDLCDASYQRACNVVTGNQQSLGSLRTAVYETFRLFTAQPSRCVDGRLANLQLLIAQSLRELVATIPPEPAYYQDAYAESARAWMDQETVESE